MNQTSATCSCPDYRLGRRRFLGAAAATAGVVAGAQLFGETYRQVAYADDTSTTAPVVVILSLRGGADGLSMVVPSTADDQEILRQVRPDLYLPAASLIAGDTRFGLHPAFDPLKDMWSKTKNFAAVHSVGLPAPNRSHFDAMIEVEDADPGNVVRTGWINRATGISAMPQLENAMQLGSVLTPSSLRGPEPQLAVNTDADIVIAQLGTTAQRRSDSLTALYASDAYLGPTVTKVIGTTGRLAGLASDAAVPGKIVHTSQYPPGPLQEVLANTSALIRANVGARFVTVDYGNWDMHAGLGAPDSGWMHDQVTHLAGSLKAFFDDLGTDASRVTVVTMSEFGRRVAQNDSAGLDHGYGNAMMVLGAGVNGGQVHGPWSGLGALNDGDVPVQTNFQSVLWEVLNARFPDLSGSRATIFPDADQQTLGVMT